MPRYTGHAASFHSTRSSQSRLVHQREQIRRFADKAGLAVGPLWRVVQETVDATVEAWCRHDAKAMLPDDIRTSLDRHLIGTAGRTRG